MEFFDSRAVSAAGHRHFLTVSMTIWKVFPRFR